VGLVVNPPVGFGMSVPVVLPDTLIVVLLTVVTGGTTYGWCEVNGGTWDDWLFDWGLGLNSWLIW
jgi:hypothetical protein